MTEPMPRIESATSDERPHAITIKWTDGRVATIDLVGVIARVKAFAPLKDPCVFRQVKVIDHGWAVGWSGGLDYSAISLDRLAQDQNEKSGRHLDSL